MKSGVGLLVLGFAVGCVRPQAPGDDANGAGGTGGAGDDAGGGGGVGGGGGGGVGDARIDVPERVVAGCPVPLHVSPATLEPGVTWEVAGVGGATSNIGTLTSQLGRPYFAPPANLVGCALLRARLASGATLEKQVCFAPLPIVASPQVVPIRGRRALLPTGADPTSFRFSVNGQAGGNADVGFVSPGGVYRAPASFPTGVRLPLAITARVEMPACADVFANVDIVLVDIVATPGEISAMRVAGKSFDIEARAVYTSPIATAAGLALSENITTLATTTWTPDKPAVAGATPGRVTLGAEPGRATVRVTDTRFDPAPTDLVAVESRAAYELQVYARRGGNELRVTESSPLISVIRGERVPLIVYAVDTEGAAAGKLREAARDRLTFSGAVTNGVVAAPPQAAAVVEHVSLDANARPVARQLAAVFGFPTATDTVAATVKNEDDNRETTFKLRAIELLSTAAVTRQMPPWSPPAVPASFLTQKVLPSVSESLIATAWNYDEGVSPSTLVDVYVTLPADVCTAGLVDLSMFSGELFTVTVKTQMATPPGKSPVVFGEFSAIDTNQGWDRTSALSRDGELHGNTCGMKGTLSAALLDNAGPVELAIQPSRRLALLGDTALARMAFTATLVPRIPDGPAVSLFRPLPMHPTLMVATATTTPDMAKSGYRLEVELNGGGQARAPFLIAPANRHYFTANWGTTFTARGRWIAKTELSRVTWKGAWGPASDGVEILEDKPINGCHAPTEPASGVVRPDLSTEKVFSYVARSANFETGVCENNKTTLNEYDCSASGPRPSCCDTCPGLCGFYTGVMMGFRRFDDTQKPVVAEWGEPFADAGAATGGYVRVISDVQGILSGCDFLPITPDTGFMPKAGTNKVTFEYVTITPGLRDNFSSWWDNPVIIESPSDAVFAMPNAIALPTPRALAPPVNPRVAAKLAGKPAANVADIDLVFDEALTTKPGDVNTTAQVSCADGGTPAGLAATFIAADSDAGTLRPRIRLSNLPAREADAGVATFDEALDCRVKLDNGLTDIELRLFATGLAERRREVASDPQSAIPYEENTRSPLGPLATNVSQGGAPLADRPFIPGTGLRANGKYLQALGPALITTLDIEALASRRIRINADDPGNSAAPNIDAGLAMVGFGPIVPLESQLSDSASSNVRAFPAWDVRSPRTVVPVGGPPRPLYVNPTDLLAFDLGQKKFAAEPGYVFRAGRGPLYAASGTPLVRAAARGYVERTTAADGVEEIVVSDLSDLQPDFLPDLFSASKDTEYIFLWQGDRLVDVQPFTAVAVVGAPPTLRRSDVDESTGGATNGVSIPTSDDKIFGSLQAGRDIGFVVDPLLASSAYANANTRLTFAPERDYPFLYWDEANYAQGRNPVNWVKAASRAGGGAVSGLGHRFGFQVAGVVTDDDEAILIAGPYDFEGYLRMIERAGAPPNVVVAAGATSGGAVFGGDNAMTPYLGATVSAQTPGFNTPDVDAWDIDGTGAKQTHVGDERKNAGFPAPITAGVVVAGDNAHLRLITIPDNGQGEPLLTGDVEGSFTFLVHPMYVEQTHLETTARFDSTGFVLSFIADKGYDLATRIACAALTGGTDVVATVAGGVKDYIVGEMIAGAADFVDTGRHWLRAPRDGYKVFEATRDFYAAQARFRAISAAIRTNELPVEAVVKLQDVRTGTISTQTQAARAIGKSICGAAANIVKEALLKDAIEGLYSATSVRAESDETLIVHLRALDGNITRKFNEVVEDIYPKGSGWKGSWQDLFEVWAAAKQRRGRAELANDTVRTITVNGANVRLAPSNDPDPLRHTKVPFQHVVNMYATRSSVLGSARANRTLSGHYSLVPGNASITAPAP